MLCCVSVGVCFVKNVIVMCLVVLILMWRRFPRVSLIRSAIVTLLDVQCHGRMMQGFKFVVLMTK
eukprot:2577904-Amphidinium_carterae.1